MCLCVRDYRRVDEKESVIIITITIIIHNNNYTPSTHNQHTINIPSPGGGEVRAGSRSSRREGSGGDEESREGRGEEREEKGQAIEVNTDYRMTNKAQRRELAN